MSALVKLASVMPGEEEVNGLDCLHQVLVDMLDSDSGIVVISVMDVADVTRKAGGEEEHIAPAERRHAIGQRRGRHQHSERAAAQMDAGDGGKAA